MGREAVSGKTAGGKLQAKTIRLGQERTSLRLEPEIWTALNDIARAEGCHRADLIKQLRDRTSHGLLAAAVRVFVISYYRQKAQNL